MNIHGLKQRRKNISRALRSLKQNNKLFEMKPYAEDLRDSRKSIDWKIKKIRKSRPNKAKKPNRRRK